MTRFANNQISKDDIYTRVTNQLIDAIESNTTKFQMPWHNSGAFFSSPINAITKKRYRGVNILSLWAIAQKRGYDSGLWATYQQWQEAGAQVRKGEKATLVVFWQFPAAPASPAQSASTDGQDAQDKPTRRPPFARAYSVFNVAQVDGYTAPVIPALPELERISQAETFFANVDAKVIHGGNQACYCPDLDEVHMPKFNQFRNAIAYYATLGHELVHWTSHPDRCDRQLHGRFGSESYAAEELVAELGAAFLCAELQLSNEPRQDHAAYLQSWLKILKNDKKAIFTAATKAQEAVQWLCSLQPDTTPTEQDPLLLTDNPTLNQESLTP